MIDAGTTQAEADPAPERRDLYRYVTADNAEEYIAIMRLFSSTLLADLSAGEAQSALERFGAQISVDDPESRCRQLEQWGNLVRSVRDAAPPPWPNGSAHAPGIRCPSSAVASPAKSTR